MGHYFVDIQYKFVSMLNFFYSSEVTPDSLTMDWFQPQIGEYCVHHYQVGTRVGPDVKSQ